MYADQSTGRWSSVDAVALRLAVPAELVQELIDEGKLATHVVDGRVRISSEDLDCFIRASAIRPGELGDVVDLD